MAPRASTSQDAKRKSGSKRPSAKQVFTMTQHDSRKIFQDYMRSILAVPRSGAPNVEVRHKFSAVISASNVKGTDPGCALYFGAHDRKGKATGEEWSAAFEGSLDLIPKEYRSKIFNVKRSRSDSDDEASLQSESEGEADAAGDVNEAPATSPKGKARATSDAEKPAPRAASMPRKTRRAPAAKRARPTPVKKPARDLDDDSAELTATAASPRERADDHEHSEPPVASTSGSASPAAGASSSVAAASEAGPSYSSAVGPALPSEGILGRGRRVTRGLYGRTATSPARDFGPAFAAAPEAVAFTYDTPAFRMSPRKAPPSIGGESALERLCSRVDDLDVESSAASVNMDTDTERGTPAPEGAADVDAAENDREATPVAAVASSSPVTRSAAKGKARAL